MRALILITAASLAVSGCDAGVEGDSAPAEESPVAPAVVCDDAAENAACENYDDVVTNEDIADGNVITKGEGLVIEDRENVPAPMKAN